MHIEVRAYGQLVDLVEGRELAVPFGEPRSVKDLIESVGIPHPEVGLLLVEGSPVGFDHLLVGGERVAVYPPFCELAPDAAVDLWPTPPEPRRFVLDVHLGTLARRLRLLGFDSWYRTDSDDADLARLAIDEQRILLSRDRKLLMRREIVHAYCPRSDDPDEQAIEVADRYDLAERRAPLTRCVRCNGELAPVDKAEVLEELPPRTRHEFDTFARCRRCGQVYWPGSHLDAVEPFLARIAELPD
ncbi:MAG: Mut7-C RNAse domain-containing protein [Nitriliruptoraceae bacterium]